MFFWNVPSPHSFPSIFFSGFLLDLAVSGKFLFVSDSIRALDVQVVEFFPHGRGTDGVVVFLSEMNKNVGEVDVFFLHFLVVTSALLSLPGADEEFHGFEYFVGSTHVTVDKVLVVNFQEPVVSLVLLGQPVPMILLL